MKVSFDVRHGKPQPYGEYVLPLAPHCSILMAAMSLATATKYSLPIKMQAFHAGLVLLPLRGLVY